MDGMIAEIDLYTLPTFGNVFPPKLIEQIWSATTSGRSIRRLVVDYYVKHVSVEAMKAEPELYHHEFTKGSYVQGHGSCGKRRPEHLSEQQRCRLLRRCGFTRLKLLYFTFDDRVDEASSVFFYWRPAVLEQVTMARKEHERLSERFEPSLTVPEGLLIEHSAFFRAACRNGWKEATSRVIPVPDVDPDMFRAYLYRVHRKQIAFDILETDDDENPAGDLEVQRALNDLFEPWLLANGLSDTTLRNRVMDALLYIIREYGTWIEDNAKVITPETVSSIWSRTAGDRAIRRLVVDYYALYGWANEVVLFVDECGTDFKQDLLLRILELARVGDRGNLGNFKPGGIDRSLRRADPTRQKPCHYHEHDEQHPKCLSGHGNPDSRDNVMQDAEQRA